METNYEPSNSLVHELIYNYAKAFKMVSKPLSLVKKLQAHLMKFITPCQRQKVNKSLLLELPAEVLKDMNLSAKTT